MKTLHAITLRKRRTWVTVVSALMLVTLVASFVAWPSPEQIEESSVLTAWLATIGERWLSLVLWAGLALVAFGAQLLRAGGLIGALAGEARQGAVDFWAPALPWRNERRTFSVDASRPLKVSLVERSDMYPNVRYPHVLLESGEEAYTAKLDGKPHQFVASGIVELARHAGIAVEIDESAREIVAESRQG